MIPQHLVVTMLCLQMNGKVLQETQYPHPAPLGVSTAILVMCILHASYRNMHMLTYIFAIHLWNL